MITIYGTHLDDFIPHWHNRLTYVQFHILVLITEGKVRYQLNDREFIASKGDLLFIPSGTHREAKNDVEPHQKYAITFMVPADLELTMLHSKETIVLRAKQFDYFKEKFKSLHRQSLEKRPYYHTIQSGILLEMLGTLNRELESSPMIPARKLHYAGVLEQYIVQHFRESIALNTLATLIDRSPNYTLSVFKEVVGQTPLEYQHRLRITSAMELLQNTNLTITFIADHLGYYDTSYFYKMFRKYTGVAPSSYMDGKSTPTDSVRVP